MMVAPAMSRKYLDGVYVLGHVTHHSYVLDGMGWWHERCDLVEHYEGWEFEKNIPCVVSEVLSLAIPIHYCK